MKRAVTIAVIVLLAGWALLLRPAPLLGGTTSYVMVHGNSMLPHLHNGDLVVARAQPTYPVGAVVAYHVPQGQLGQRHLVIHRVVSVSRDGSLTLRGDNNPTNDPWHPRAADVGGAERLRVPKAGGMLLVLRTPAVAALVGAGLAIWVVYRRERVLERLERMYPEAWNDGSEQSAAASELQGRPAGPLRARFSAPHLPGRAGRDPRAAAVTVTLP